MGVVFGNSVSVLLFRRLVKSEVDSPANREIDQPGIPSADKARAGDVDVTRANLICARAREPTK